MTQQQSEYIDSLYLEMQPLLLEYARAVLMNEALAEESVQEAFRIACQKPEDLCTSPNPRGWITNVLKNVISNTRKRNVAAERMLTEYYHIHSEEVSTHEMPMDVGLLFRDVADQEDFQMVKEMAVEGRSYLEIARERRISLSACRKRMQRARENLQKKMKKYVTK